MMTPEPAATNNPASPGTTVPAPRAWYRQPALLVAVAIAVLLGVQWFDSHQQMKLLQEELAHRSAPADGGNREGRDGQARDADGAPAEVAKRDSANPPAALDAVYQEIARGRDEALLAELEQTLLLAGQQIRIAGDVAAALSALQVADARLARLDRPQLAAARKALGRDMERLKSAPRIDLPAIAARLDELAAGVDALPLQSESHAVEAAPARKPSASAEADPWLRLVREFWQDILGLVRVEKIDQAGGAPLAASQAFFLRENLRLRLLSARLALLARNDKSYRADLKTAAEWLARYFDTRRDPAAAALASVRQLHDSALSVELPDFAASLDAVRGLRAAAARR